MRRSSGPALVQSALHLWVLVMAADGPNDSQMSPFQRRPGGSKFYYRCKECDYRLPWPYAKPARDPKFCKNDDTELKFVRPGGG